MPTRQVSNKNGSAFSYAYRARLHERQTQWKTNRISDSLSEKNWHGRGAASLGLLRNWATRGSICTSSSAANGSTRTCFWKSAICWIMISLDAFRITETARKKTKNHEKTLHLAKKLYFCGRKTDGRKMATANPLITPSVIKSSSTSDCQKQYDFITGCHDKPRADLHKNKSG